MTPNDVKVLDFVRERIAVTGFGPSIVEIGRHLGCKGKSHPHTIVDRLVDEGYLKRIPNRARGLRLADTPDLRAAPTDALRAELARRGETFDALADRPRGQFRRGVATCAADCCREEVRRGKLFCRRHWFLLPFSLRQDILAAFAADDEALYQLYVSEARDRIDRGAGATDPRRQS